MSLNSIKSFIKKILPITNNIRYDNQTVKIMEIVLESDSTFIDVGCHKGEVLDQAIKFSPNGRHFGYEPIPHLYSDLVNKYDNKCQIKNFALSDSIGESEFHHVVSNPAYSGIKKRSYPGNENVNKIKIKTTTLDDELINESRVDLIKIDVEGGEYGVLKGGKNIINKFHPVFIFEHGLGASDYYDTNPSDLYDFFESLDYNIYTLKGFINQSTILTKEKFVDLYLRNKEYYFLSMFKA
jgi:FkbM family methyltransferase